MKTQNKPLDQIYDMVAVRVIVETVDECYEVFGKIHKIWRPVPGRIKDYIATPKKNMYQSLHTTVIGEENGNAFDRFASFTKADYDKVFATIANGSVDPIRTFTVVDANGYATAEELVTNLGLTKLSIEVR